MSYLWICLNLLFVLQQSVSSDEAVSLICPEKMEVEAQHEVTLNCSIEWKTGKDCSIKKFFCRDRNVPIDCRTVSRTYICDWAQCSVIFLTITGVDKDTNVTVDISSSCGLDFQVIQVHVKDVLNTSIQVAPEENRKPPLSQSDVIPTILGVLTTIIVLAILIFLVRYYLTQRSKPNQRSGPEGYSSVVFRTPA